MSNEFDDIDIKNHSFYFSLMILPILKTSIQITLKQMKSPTKLFLFTTLGM